MVCPFCAVDEKVIVIQRQERQLMHVNTFFPIISQVQMYKGIFLHLQILTWWNGTCLIYHIYNKLIKLFLHFFEKIVSESILHVYRITQFHRFNIKSYLINHLLFYVILDSMLIIDAASAIKLHVLYDRFADDPEYIGICIYNPLGI